MIRCHQCRFWNRARTGQDGFALCNLLSNEADTISDLAKVGAKGGSGLFVTAARFGCVDGEPDLAAEPMTDMDAFISAWIDRNVEIDFDESGKRMIRYRPPETK